MLAFMLCGCRIQIVVMCRYQKTSETFKSAADKTGAMFQSFSGETKKKLGELRYKCYGVVAISGDAVTVGDSPSKGLERKIAWPHTFHRL